MKLGVWLWTEQYQVMIDCSFTGEGVQYARPSPPRTSRRPSDVPRGQTCWRCECPREPGNPRVPTARNGTMLPESEDGWWCALDVAPVVREDCRRRNNVAGLWRDDDRHDQNVTNGQGLWSYQGRWREGLFFPSECRAGRREVEDGWITVNAATLTIRGATPSGERRVAYHDEHMDGRSERNGFPIGAEYGQSPAASEVVRNCYRHRRCRCVA
jgi:hypothetical protein